MNRRDFLWAGSAAGMALAAGARGWMGPMGLGPQSYASEPPAYSVVPVVGDGRWIWNKPPETERGYLEPRSFSLSVGMEMEGIGDATEIQGSTAVPVEHPEQKIDSVQLETEGCEATLRQLTSTAGQLYWSAPAIAKGQTIKAVAHYKLTLTKQYQGYERDQFPEKQDPPAEVRKNFLQDSPGIETRSRQVRALVTEISKTTSKHPWDLARAFATWIPQHIKPQIGSYTSVATALETRRGDCEEMSGIFVALCRAVGIPARLVWVPNHAWSEMYLTDNDGQGHWLPVHTACYFWFGWNGAHELVLQKGDRLVTPERRKQLRLIDDWLQWSGRRPRTRFVAELAPEAASPGDDAGPGARRKEPNGQWALIGEHSQDRYVRR